MMMTADDGFQVRVQHSHSKTSLKRIYIGNLPKQCNDLKAKLVDFLNEKADLNVEEKDVTVVVRGSALVACTNVNRAISILNNSEFEGNKISVQRERKKDPNKSNKQSFGGGGWNRPLPNEKARTSAREAQKCVKERPLSDSKHEFAAEPELSQHLGSIVASEIKAAGEDPSNGDVVNTMIASTAAMTLLSSVDAFGLGQTNEMVVGAPKQPLHTAPVADEALNTPAPETKFDFTSQSKKPMSELMADYGEQDLNFKSVVPTQFDEKPLKKEKKREDYNNRLTLQGKAPIHVEVTSFGYMHGVPSDVRSGGWSHAHPLSPFDCRDLPQVPHYMARQDGLSPAVKRAVLNAARDEDEDDSKRDTSVHKFANDLGAQIFDAVHEAISVGGYGHASPLRMTVYVGSDSGRHRSVVVCELAATALRKLLRENKDDRITQPVSVGTRHRDIERRQQRDTERRPKSKQMEFESEW